MSKVRADAERAWREGKRSYLVRITQMPGPAVEPEPEPEPESKPWRDPSLSAVERAELFRARKKPDRVDVTHMPDIEDALEAICDVGWEVQDLRLGETSVPMFGSKLTLLTASVAFVRPSA